MKAKTILNPVCGMWVTLLALSGVVTAQPADSTRLVIRGAMLVDGSGSAPRGPVDVVVEEGRIRQIVTLDALSRARGSERPSGGRIVEADGMYVLPGLIDMHAHIPAENTAYGPDYAFKLWLGHGITTIREAGSFSGFDYVKRLRAESTSGQRVAPRIQAYRRLFADQLPEPSAARAVVERYKAEGADGIKLSGVYPDLLAAVGRAAREAGLPIMQHNSIANRGLANALDAARAGVTSIEHWYGVPETAIPGGQDLPPNYNELDELDRFRWAGRLWQQVDLDRFDEVIDEMVALGISWDPTIAVYEDNRDLLRARHLPWHQDYSHPALYRRWEPDEAVHGSYHHEWTTLDEVAWAKDMRIWMAAVLHFARAGGIVTTGADSGTGYHLYGFSFVRELEIQAEAGFSPREIIRHATYNGAQVLGEDRLGMIRTGWRADLIVVPGNPLADLKVLYGAYGSGGVRYTVKDGRLYDARELLAEVRAQVAEAKSKTSER